MRYTRLCVRLFAVVLACTLASPAFSPNPVLPKPRDLNGDGKDDIIWRNTNTESAALWVMNGVAPSAQTSFNAFPYVTRWTGDFDGDGKTDILFRNNQFMGAGEIAAWLMNGTAVTGSTIL